MSYPRDLDEYTDHELSDEQRRRVVATNNGNCDYCGRPAGIAPACKFPNRHRRLAATLLTSCSCGIKVNHGGVHKPDCDGLT